MTDDRECLHALAALYQFLDHELTEADADVIRAHLDACEPCLDQYGVEETVRALVKRCCGAEHAPQTLRLRVMTHISTVVITEA